MRGHGGIISEGWTCQNSASISSGIAARYATAVFEIAHENNELETLESNLDDLSAALNDSADLRDLIHSPVYTRETQGRAITAVAQKMDLIAGAAERAGSDGLQAPPLRRAAMVAQLREMIAEHKGEVTADVTSAATLSDEQRKTLSETLKARVGRDVHINATVDESLIGGLVVKVGSKMIDTSIRSKLNSLQNAMKEVG